MWAELICAQVSGPDICGLPETWKNTALRKSSDGQRMGEQNTRHPRTPQYPSHWGGSKITPLFFCERCLTQFYHEFFFSYTATFIKHRSLHCWADSIKKISIDHQTLHNEQFSVQHYWSLYQL